MTAKAYSRQDLEALADGFARQKGIPAWWAKAIIEQESNWNPAAGNSTDGGSTGLMQVHPSNFRRFNTNAQQMRDPVRNLDVGTTIAKEALDRAGGDLRAALIDYNAGGPRFAAFKARQPIRKTGELLQPTTEEYIPSVMLRGMKYGGPVVTAQEYADTRQRFGSSQTSDAEIFRKTGVQVQGWKGMAQQPVQPAQSTQVATRQLLRPPVAPPDQSAQEDAVAPVQWSAAEPQPKAPQKAQHDPEMADVQRQAIAQAFGGQDDEANYPDWLVKMVQDEFRYA
jgi:hypothetical protein